MTPRPPSEEVRRWIDDAIDALADARNERIEALARAYVTETGLRPSECVLNIQQDGLTTRYWVTRRLPAPDAARHGSIIRLGVRFDWCVQRGSVWFRLNGWGASIENRRLHPALFAERYGYRRVLRLGRLAMHPLRPDAT